MENNKDLTETPNTVIPAYEPESINADLNQTAGFFRPNGLRMTPRLARVASLRGATRRPQGDQYSKAPTSLGIQASNPADENANVIPHYAAGSPANNARRPRLGGRGDVKTAFTLAEVLITLGIIGVVAAMTLPTLIGIGKQHAWEKQKLVFEQKFREATAQMKVADNLSGHPTTEAFVAELSKYMKLAKKCDNSNIQNCYAPKIILGVEDEAETNSLTTSASLGRETYNTNTMGLVVLDGVSVILAYDPKCEPIDPADNTKDTLACLSIVYDVNGHNTPNKIGMDIVTLNAAITTCDLKIGSLCTTGGDTPFTPIKKDNPIYKPCLSGSTDYCASNGNYWQGAGEACKALGMRLPTMDELAKIASDQYGVSFSAFQDRNSGLTIDPKSKANLSGWYWSAQESSSYTSYYRTFNTRSSYYINYGKYYSGGKARCVK